MLRSLAKVSPALVRPLILIGSATFIVVAGITFVAPKVAGPIALHQGTTVERVMMQRALKINVPSQNQSAFANGAPSGTPKASVAAPQIARVGEVQLFVANVDDAVATLRRVTNQNFGDILGLTINNESGDGAPPNANVNIRVPAARFDSTMAALAGVGKVRERSITGEDVTDQVTDSAARLRNLERTEGDILRIMDRSGTVGQILDAETQLSTVRENIETLEADLKTLRMRVVYSTIAVTLTNEETAASVEPTPLSQLASALRAAVHSVSQTAIGLAGVLLWILVYVPFVFALILLARAGYGAWRRFSH